MISEQSELEGAEKAGQFTVLKPWLVGDTPALSQAQAGVKLGMSEGAIKVAIHRMRRRFRELVKVEITQTVPESTDAEGELQHLIAALTAS